ncbi:condensation domain-containing protein, partial [Staphylococcus epidermidis]|uniref:condensation domain-containing protein n=1 Tax=Staphylococcus epidermidis TaxID=1282 RepID=UPI001E4B1910
KIQLRQKLPEYMIPMYMMQIDELPVTSNGKLNKKALPEIKVQHKTHVEPQNETEKMLVDVFKNVLNLDSVSTEDNFFEIGGHSLKAISVINNIENQIDVRIPLKTIFEHPTVKQLTVAIKDMNEYRSDSDMPKVDVKSHYLTSSPQRRLYVLNEMDDKQTTYNMPGALEIKGKVDVDQVKYAFTKIIERHESLRTHFDTIDGEPVQIVHDTVNFQMEI